MTPCVKRCSAAFDSGITYFDLANNYGPVPGSAEENFGRILHGELAAHRDELVAATKAGYRTWPRPLMATAAAARPCWPAWTEALPACG